MQDVIDLFKSRLLIAINDFCNHHLNNTKDEKFERWLKDIRRKAGRYRDRQVDVPAVMGLALWFANSLASLGVSFGLAPNHVTIVEIPSHLDEKLVKRCLMLCSATLALQYLPRDPALEVSMYIPTKVAAKVIRKALKSKCKTLSVRKGRGTAAGWIEIWGSGDFHDFTKEELETLKFFGIPAGGNCAVISPDNRKYYVEKICKLCPEAKAVLIRERLKEGEKW